MRIGKQWLETFRIYYRLFNKFEAILFSDSPDLLQLNALSGCEFPVVLQNSLPVNNKRLKEKLVNFPIAFNEIDFPNNTFDLIYYKPNGKKLQQQQEELDIAINYLKHNGSLALEIEIDVNNPIKGYELFNLFNKKMIWKYTIDLQNKYVIVMGLK